MRRHPIRHQPVILLAVVALAAVGATLTSVSQGSSRLAKVEVQNDASSKELRERRDPAHALASDPAKDARLPHR